MLEFFKNKIEKFNCFASPEINLYIRFTANTGRTSPDEHFNPFHSVYITEFQAYKVTAKKGNVFNSTDLYQY